MIVVGVYAAQPEKKGTPTVHSESWNWRPTLIALVRRKMWMVQKMDA